MRHGTHGTHGKEYGGLVGPTGLPLGLTVNRDLVLPRSFAMSKIPPPDAVTLPDGRTLIHYAVDTIPNSVGGSWAEVSRLNGGEGLNVIASVGRVFDHGLLTGVSVSYDGHYPGWSELIMILETFFVTHPPVMMVLPRKAHYVNIHPNVFQLWEIPVDWRGVETGKRAMKWDHGDPKWDKVRDWRYKVFPDDTDCYIPMSRWEAWYKEGKRHRIEVCLCPGSWRDEIADTEVI